jgi:O-antigen/teichoic acid export membrane protein
MLLAWFIAPNSFGDYALCYALISFLALFATHWIGAAQGHLAPEFVTNRQRAELFTTSVLTSTSGSLLFALLGLLLLGMAGSGLTTSLRTTLRWGLLSLPFIGLLYPGFDALASSSTSLKLKLGRKGASAPNLAGLSSGLGLASQPNWAYRSVRRFLPAIGMIPGLLLISVLNWNVHALFVGCIAASILASPLLLWRALRERLYDARLFNPALALRLAKTGLPLLLPALCWLLVACCDRFLIALLFGISVTGNYALGWSIADWLTAILPAALLPGLAFSLAVPRRVETKVEHRAVGDTARSDVPIQATPTTLVPVVGRAQCARVMGREIAQYVLLALPVAVTLIALNSDLFRLLLPRAYSLGCLVLPWIAVSGFFFGFAQCALRPLLWAGQTGRYARVMASGVLLNFALNMLLIPMLGLGGAGMAAALTAVTISMSLARAGREVVAWSLAPASIVVPAASAGTMVVSLLALGNLLLVNPWTLVLKVFAGFGVYLAVAGGGLRLAGLLAGRRGTRFFARPQGFTPRRTEPCL